MGRWMVIFDRMEVPSVTHGAAVGVKQGVRYGRSSCCYKRWIIRSNQ